MVPNVRIGLYVSLGLVVAALAAGIACYVIHCVRWRRRIAEVREGQPVYWGWNLNRLKESVRVLEYEKVSRMELLFP